MMPCTGIGKLFGTTTNSISISTPAATIVVWCVPNDCTDPSVTPTIFIILSLSIIESSDSADILINDTSACESTKKLFEIDEEEH